MEMDCIEKMFLSRLQREATIYSHSQYTFLKSYAAVQCKNLHSLQRFTFITIDNSRGIQYYYLLS